MSACPNESALLGYLQWQLPPPERERIEQHLLACITCRRLVAMWASRSKQAMSGVLSQTEGSFVNHPEPAVGDEIGHFEILGRLGVGAFGTVYEARDRRIRRRVALKLVPGTPDEASRMLREGQALGRLSHPNVVAIYEVEEVRGGLAVAMELVEGSTLAQWANSADVGTRQIAAMFVQVSQGLAAVHDAGLVHRDVKPPNVVIGDDGRARLVDFGLAHPSDAQTSKSRPDATIGVSGIGVFGERSRWTGAGTPAYMAPELLTGAPATHQSDQYSLCVALHEVLYGSGRLAVTPLNSCVLRSNAAKRSCATMRNRYRNG